jgi:stearoyl-CoA desaturase (delta-9 desaturase)
MSPNFAARWFEIDPAYQVIRVFAAIGIVQIATTQRMRWPAEDTASSGGVAADPAE